MTVIENMFNKITMFFKTLFNYDTLGKSTKEIVFLTIIALLPMIASVVITWLSTSTFSQSVKENIIPGEIVAFSLSIITPNLYLIVKTHGQNYRLPFLLGMMILTIIVYTLTGLIYIVAKNKWVPAINMEAQHNGLYFTLSLIFLFLSFFIWIYAAYHDENFTDYNSQLRQGQQNFNTNFRSSLNP